MKHWTFEAGNGIIPVIIADSVDVWSFAVFAVNLGAEVATIGVAGNPWVLPSADDFASWRSEFTRRYFHGMLARIEYPLAGHVSRIFARLGPLSIQNQAFAVQVLRRNLREIQERAAQIEE